MILVLCNPLGRVCLFLFFCLYCREAAVFSAHVKASQKKKQQKVSFTEVPGLKGSAHRRLTFSNSREKSSVVISSPVLFFFFFCRTWREAVEMKTLRSPGFVLMIGSRSVGSLWCSFMVRFSVNNPGPPKSKVFPAQICFYFLFVSFVPLQWWDCLSLAWLALVLLPLG